MDIFFAYSIICKICQYSIYFAQLQCSETLSIFLLSVCLKLPSQSLSFFPSSVSWFLSDSFIFPLFMCLIWPFCTSVCCVSISHYFIILLCHWHLPLWPLLHKHFTSPPLFLFPFSSSVFPSLPSSVCLSVSV